MKHIALFALLASFLISFGAVAAPYTTPENGNQFVKELDNKTTVAVTYDSSGNIVPIASGGSGTSANQIQGNAASGSTDSGNPVKVGGVYHSVLGTTLADGQRGDLQMDVGGYLLSSPRSRAVTLTDAASNSTSLPANAVNAALVSTGYNYNFNGTTWDRDRGDTNGKWIQGNVASGTSDVGNPVKVGGVFNTALPTLGNGQRGDFQLGTDGSLVTAPRSNTMALVTSVTASSVLLGTNRSGAIFYSAAVPYVYDGTNITVQKGNSTGTYMVSPPLAGTDRSATATTTSAQLMATNTSRVRFFIRNDTAIVVWINMGATAVASAGSGNIAIAANGGYFEFAGYSGAVNIIAASTTAAVTAREF